MVSSCYTLHGYSISENQAHLVFNSFDYRKNYITYYVKVRGEDGREEGGEREGEGVRKGGGRERDIERYERGGGMEREEKRELKRNEKVLDLLLEE